MEPEPAPAGAPDLDALALAARAGDPAAAAALHDRLGPALLAWACLRVPRALRSRLDPEDLVQEVWCRVLGAFASFDPARGGFRPWAFGVAAHVLLKALRAGTWRGGAGPAPESWVPRSRPEPTSVATRLARREEVLAFVGRLSDLDDADRRLLVHRGMEDRDHDEVAALLGVSPDNARKRWQRLRERLRSLGAPAGLFES